MTRFKVAATLLLAAFMSTNCASSAPAPKVPPPNATPGDNHVANYLVTGSDANDASVNKYAASAWPHIPDRPN